jgi:hypothetical protein
MRLRVAVSIGILGAIGVISTLFFSQGVRAQDSDQTSTQEVLANINLQLAAKHIPVTAVQIIQDKSESVPYPMDVLELTLNSTSKDDKVSPDDAIYVNLAGHEVKLAQLRGLKAEAYRTTIINLKGDILQRVIIPLRGSDALPSGWERASQLSPSEVTEFLKRIPVGDMSIDNIQVLADQEGLLACTINIQSDDILSANAVVGNVVNEMLTSVINLNKERGAAIAVCILRIHYPDGRPVLNYIVDLQLGRTTWWQVDELSKDWFNHPPDIQEAQKITQP